MLLDLVGKKPVMLLIFYNTQHSPQQQRITQPKISLVLALRNSALDKSLNSFVLILTFKLAIDIVRQKAQ